MKLLWSTVAAFVLSTGVALAQTPSTVRICNGTQPNCPLIGASNGLPVNIVSGGSGGGAVTMASGAVASGAYSSGSIASGAFASGAVGAGAYALGAFASGSIASGAMVDLGAIADAASSAGGTGSVNAKLRLMTTQLGTINTTLSTPFQAGGSIGNTTFASTQSGTWTVQPGNTPNTTPWLTTNTPSSAAGAATTSASSTAAASSLVLKASAGNLYSLTVTIGATSGYAMLFDATSLPGNGAITPVWCYPVTSNGTNGGVAIEFATPKRFGTGITAGFSTTGCFTQTASATANFFGGYQ